jgi:glycosyltransferase involved in cell wall biosynthesis
MNKKPILSICIPTFEREQDLFRCLDSIVKILQDISIDIEVCVSDNNSSYDFETLKNRYIHFKNFKFNRSEKNLGFDRNLLNVLRMATGKYAMLMGNDDTISKNGFISLVKTLEESSPDAVFSNYRINFTSKNYSELAYQHMTPLTMLTFNWVLSSLKIKCGFISSITFSLKLIDLESDEYNKYLDSGFIHIAIAFKSLIHKNRIAYIPMPTVDAYDNNLDHYDVKEVFLKGLIGIIDAYKEYYDEKSINAFKDSILKYVTSASNNLTLSDLIIFNYKKPRHFILYLITKLKKNFRRVLNNLTK